MKYEKPYTHIKNQSKRGESHRLNRRKDKHSN